VHATSLCVVGLLDGPSASTILLYSIAIRYRPS
jgi:hypothetical protein